MLSVPDPARQPPDGGNGDSWGPIVSEDGRFVLFASTANNLVATASGEPLPATFPAVINLYLRDRVTSKTSLVSWNVARSAGGNGDSVPIGMSRDCRYILFESDASDLVSGDTNHATDIFVRDLLGDSNILISASTEGVIGNLQSKNPAMTPDGRFVAFVSRASNLVPFDTNGMPDVFVHDCLTAQTKQVSLAGTATNYSSNYPIVDMMSEFPSISGDGRFVCFYSTATDLITGRGGDLFIRDTLSETTVCATVEARLMLGNPYLGIACQHPVLSDDGARATFFCYGESYFNRTGILCQFSLPAAHLDLITTNPVFPQTTFEDMRSFDVTPDGRFVLFSSLTNSAGTTNAVLAIWDALNGSSSPISIDTSNNAFAPGPYDWLSINPDGTSVAFLSTATNLATNALRGEYHLYVRDLQGFTTTLVDADADGVGIGVNPETAPALSVDARFVAFHSDDANLVPHDDNHASDVFIKDLQSGAVELVSVRQPALVPLTPLGHSSIWDNSASDDGRFIAFFSDADDLVPNDTNRCPDVFLRDTVEDRTILVSAATNGAPGAGSSREPSISADGRFVAFSSSADDLAAGDTNNTFDVFLRDLQTGRVTLLSADVFGACGDGSSHSPTLSADGTRALFLSAATNLAAAVIASNGDNLFICETASRSVLPLTFYGCKSQAMSRDGRWVAFVGGVSSTNMLLHVWDSSAGTWVYTNALTGIAGVALSPGGERVVFLRQTNLYSLDWQGNSSNLIGTYYTAGVSDWRYTPPRLKVRFDKSGQRVVYATIASQSATDTNAIIDVYAYDFQTSSNSLISRGYSGTSAGAISDSPDLSPDGRLVTYRSFASNIVSGDLDDNSDLFLFDSFSQQSSLITTPLRSADLGNAVSINPLFLEDGRTVVFQTWSPSLVPGGLYTGSQLLTTVVQPSSFRVSLQLNAAANQAVLRWPTIPGRSYRVQFRPDLGQGVWQDLTGDLSPPGPEAAFTNTVPSASQAFYRIVGF